MRPDRRNMIAMESLIPMIRRHRPPRPYLISTRGAAIERASLLRREEREPFPGGFCLQQPVTAPVHLSIQTPQAAMVNTIFH